MEVAMNLYNKIFQYIASHKRGWVFSPSDLTHRFTRQQVDNALSHLVKNGKIRRIARGMYDYPRYSTLFDGFRAPNMDKVVNAYTRKQNCDIGIVGDIALNYLNLSTQLVTKHIYMSSGKNRIYKLSNGLEIEFKKAKSKDIGFKYRMSSIIVQALKSLGKERIDNRVIEKIRKQVPPSMRTKIINDTKNTTAWIHKVIKQICKE